MLGCIRVVKFIDVSEDRTASVLSRLGEHVECSCLLQQPEPEYVTLRVRARYWADHLWTAASLPGDKAAGACSCPVTSN